LYPEQIHHHFGAIFMYMASLTTNMNNFHLKNRGKVVGILDASFSAGPALMSFLYGLLFAEGHTNDQQNQKLNEFVNQRYGVYKKLKL
jgi:MFS family permease